MTAYNRERYIAAAIESVLAQTFTDFELIVVDDGSTDRTLDVARSYAALDPRVRVFANESNLGDYPNRNRAASLAHGRFLKYHDSDDVMYPHCLMTMVPALEREASAGFALSMGSHWAGGPCPMLSTPRMSYQREFLGQGLFMCGPAGALFRADVFRALGGFENVGAASDHAFWLRACARHAVLLVPADLFWYRTHALQELHSERALRDYARVPGYVWKALDSPECPLEGDEREQAKRNQAFTVARQAWRHVRRGQWRVAAFRLRTCGLTLADWVRYLRKPRRSPLAGTPLTADGDYVIPGLSAEARRAKADWTRSGPPQVGAR
jgi:hypothetical protein